MLLENTDRKNQMTNLNNSSNFCCNCTFKVEESDIVLIRELQRYYRIHLSHSDYAFLDLIAEKHRLTEKQQDRFDEIKIRLKNPTFQKRG